MRSEDSERKELDKGINNDTYLCTTKNNNFYYEKE
jgi:hypothetical protein